MNKHKKFKEDIMKKLFVLVLAIVFCLAMVACSAPAPSASSAPASSAASVSPSPSASSSAPAAVKKKVAISLPKADNAWQAALLKSIQEATKNDAEIEWTVKNAVDDADQTNILTTFKDGGYDLIACLPGDGKLQTSIMETIYDAKIPTIIIDRNIESEKYTSFVAEDNSTCGKLAADYIGKAFEGKTDVKLVVLRSYTGIPIDLARYNGFADEIKKFSNIKIIGEGDGQFNQEAGFKAMSDILAAHDKIDVVYTQDDEAATGALTAITQQNRKDITLITGMGGTVTALNEIKADNTIHKATTSYFPRIGAQAVEVIREYFKNGKVEKNNVRESKLITKDNVDEFLPYAYQ
jgi:ribose transport system substrate-binding protein